MTAAEVADSKQSLAERLGLWLGWADAIALSAALNGNSAKPPDTPSQSPFPASAAAGEFARVRAAVAHSITADRMFAAGKAHTKPAAPAPAASIEITADFSPYRRCYFAHQRAMDTGIGLLRANVRAALESFSPRLGRLAALDAVMEEGLGARERSLLSTVPLLLEKRFDRLRKAHQQALVDPQGASRENSHFQPAGWLAVYGKDMQDVLLAELDIRLQPVEGLIEALENERLQGRTGPGTALPHEMTRQP